jgi:hypothetical protein
MVKATPETPAKPRRPKVDKHLERIEATEREIEAIRLQMRLDFAQHVEVEALGDRVTNLEAQSNGQRSEHPATLTLALIATGSIAVLIGALAMAVSRLDHRLDTQVQKLNWAGDEIIQQRRAYPLPSPSPSPPPP